MQCSEETIASLFYNISSSFLILLLFTYFTSSLLAKFFYFLGGNPFFWRNQDAYEFSDDEEVEEEHEYYHNNNCEFVEENHFIDNEFLGVEKEIEESCSNTDDDYEEESIYSSIMYSESIYSDDMEVQEILDDHYDSYSDSDPSGYSDSEINEVGPTLPLPRDMNTNVLTNTIDKDINHGNCYREMIEDKKVIEINLCTREENMFVNASSSKLENNKKIVQSVQDEEKDEHEIFGDSCTNGSTSKSSTEWRSSIKDSTTDDPFSSSSRRSCPKWESYTIFQKYDEEMLFFDRISAQKLHETETLRSIQACPRSISDKIVHKLFLNKKSRQHHNPYYELEAAYVAQVCLAWEALSWNYKYFQRLRASHNNNNNKESKDDQGCPAYVAQHFQQFQVLLQRYVENEPYENGKRPEIYAKMRSLAPKLLQVPEYRDSVEEDKGEDEDYCSRISSESFHEIMKEAIRTFMNFLKADKENRYQILMAAFFRRKRRGSPHATIFLLNKQNKKKKSKVKDLQRSGKCLRNKRRLKEEEEMEILMSLIDLKLVSRVLRMRQVNEEQLHWCEDKMSKVKISDGKLQRDSSPLFFPAQ
ncbi:hypothetical protein EJD97_006345 [Solanum chilense]|uniref:Ribosomal protein L34Ae n=1 Tax=Solanum chilense TaxID=4083 RepID=A0A6N2BYD1_SOLCI|nr:hypothetical protein EJD97_006345 [Solanum chilense]